MPLKVLLSGATGAMGHHVISGISSLSGQLEITAGIALNAQEPQPHGQSFSFPCYTIDKVPQSVLEMVDVIIDFSHPDLVPSLLDLAIKHTLPIVLCTTGLSHVQQSSVEIASQIIPIFQSGNMSYGIHVLEYILRTITPRLTPDFDIEIIEKHHRRKLDAPSGTAIMLAKAIQSVAPQLNTLTGRTGGQNPRSPEDITIHAVRGGTIVGEHQVIFAGPNETISLTHQAQSRDVFAYGAIKAAQYIVSQAPAIYAMQDLIEEELTNGTI